MAKININTAKRVVPMIYAYTTPEIARHNGWTKVGYTEQDVEKRLDQQMHTADVQYHLEWRGNAAFDDGSGDIFSDHDLHAFYIKNGIERAKNTEWFHATGPETKALYYEFRENRGILKSEDLIPYSLRDEQERAVTKTLNYFNSHENSEFLWNAKPRFGKTLATYDLCKRLHAVNVLIVTNRPAIANSWYDDYEKFIGNQTGYHFVNVDGIQGRPLVLSREAYIKNGFPHG